MFLGDFVRGITNRTTQLAIVQRLICDTSFVLGEQSESASPLDPSFWPVHPTMDRLLQYKRLVAPFINTHWMNTQAQPPHGTTFCVTTQCKGHHREDVTTFVTTVQGDDGVFERRYLTNGELFEYLAYNGVKSQKAIELQKLKDRQDLEKCTFRPQIIKYARTYENNKNVYENLLQQQKDYKLYEQARKEIELKDCSF